METVLLGQSGEHQDGVVRINYKSYFPLEVKVVRNGVAENFPDADFTLTAKTEGGFTVYKAERKAGVYSHCKRDGERLIMFFDNHGLAKGRLIVSAVINHPDADYTEDGIRQENLTSTTNIELVEDNGDALQLQLPEPRVVEKVVEKSSGERNRPLHRPAEESSSVGGRVRHKRRHFISFDSGLLLKEYNRYR